MTQFQIDPPLWYKIAQSQLGFKEFLDRYNDKLFQEKDNISIFVLACLKNCDPYISGRHILSHFIVRGNVPERSLRYFYLYWTFAGDYSKDLIMADTSIAGSMSLFRLQFPIDFSYNYIMDWIAIILRSFFHVGPIVQPKQKYVKGDFVSLAEVLSYTKHLIEEKFTIIDRSIPRMFKIMQAHRKLEELKQFLSGNIFPKTLDSYRSDGSFVISIIYQYWPNVLKTLDDYKTFDKKEITLISKAHQELYEFGDVDFLFYYIDLFKRSFGEDHVLSKQLNEFLKSSRENDLRRTKQYLQKLNPKERQRYLPQYLPVPDVQIELFLREIEHNGFEQAICPYILRVKDHIQNELQNVGAKLSNEYFFSTQMSIYLYSPTEYIFFPSGNKYYVFLTDELNRLYENKKNPYSREILPEYIFTDYQTSKENKSLEEIWSLVLRRKIDLNSVFE